MSTDIQNQVWRLRSQLRPLSSEDRACVNAAVREAIAVAGSKSELARRLGVSPRCIRHWLEPFGWIPAEQAVCLELVTGIPRHRFAPRIFRPVAELLAQDTGWDVATRGVRY